MGTGHAGCSADEPAPKFTSASIHTPSTGGNGVQLTLASVGFSFMLILMGKTFKNHWKMNKLINMGRGGVSV